MKKIQTIILISAAFFSLVGCRKDDAVDAGNSIFQPSDPATITGFDKWIAKNISYPYNIDVLYKYQDINTSPKYTLVPADIENSQKMIQVVKYAWLEAYDEVVGVDFTRKYAPKQFMFVGSSAYEGSNSKVLATAEGGVKITMYEINQMSLEQEALNSYFHIIHHEFTHILTQTKNYSTDFQKISETDYIKDDWEGVYDNNARKQGFVSAYAMSEPNEDFAETYSLYVTSNDKAWKTILSDAGTAGAEKINRKLEIIREYTANSWGFDLEVLRSTVLRRTDRVPTLAFESF